MYVENNSLYFDELEFDSFIEEIEKSLHIRFENDAFIQVETVGQLFEVILNKLTYKDSIRCGSQKAFYILRQEIEHQFGQSVIPSTKLKKIIKSDVRKNWAKLSDRTQLTFPSLEQNRWQSTATLLATSTALIFFFVMFFSFTIGILVFSGACLTIWIMSKIAKELPTEDLRILVERVLEINYVKVKGYEYNRDEIRKLLKNKIIRQAEITEQQFSLNLKVTEE